MKHYFNKLWFILMIFSKISIKMFLINLDYYKNKINNYKMKIFIKKKILEKKKNKIFKK